MKLEKIREIVNGQLNHFKDIDISSIKANSKEIKPNDLFIAINSGHNYINEAIENGASALIVEKDIDFDIPLIKVESTIIALGKLAKYIRNSYNIPLIAITGSTGKTTTKELISLILSSKYKILKSEKNKNNHIGLPLTLLKLDDTYDIAVVELGMNHFKEIDYLSNICKPNYAVITNIGSAHIGNLGSKENILKAKCEILNGMDNGYLIINNNDKYIYITFDLGYESGYTNSILDTLKTNDVKAAFFITAHYVNTASDVVQRMIDEGHIVANHTVDHKSMPSLSEEQVKDELMNLHTAVYQKFNYEMTYMRPPKGEYSEKSLDATVKLGYIPVMWSFAYADWDEAKQPSHEEGINKIVQNVHNGEIMLLHATSKTNMEILDTVIKQIKDMGYEFKSLDEFKK